MKSFGIRERLKMRPRMAPRRKPLWTSSVSSTLSNSKGWDVRGCYLARWDLIVFSPRFFLLFPQDDADDCSFFFTYRYDEENNVYIRAQEKKVCPQDINFWFIIFGVILGNFFAHFCRFSSWVCCHVNILFWRKSAYTFFFISIKFISTPSLKFGKF